MDLLKLGPTWMWALLSGVIISILLVRGTFGRISLVFKVLAAALVVYIVVLVVVTHNWVRVAEYTVVPHVQLNRSYIALLVAILGTTISLSSSAKRKSTRRDARRG